MAVGDKRLHPSARQVLNRGDEPVLHLLLKTTSVLLYDGAAEPVSVGVVGTRALRFYTGAGTAPI
jgi:hypothetical protein